MVIILLPNIGEQITYASMRPKLGWLPGTGSRQCRSSLLAWPAVMSNALGSSLLKAEVGA